jgi:uncharacterized protein YwlG (UPF0340 family)
MRRLFVVRSNTATLPDAVAAAIEHTLPRSSADLRAQACEHFDRAGQLERESAKLQQRARESRRDAARHRRAGEAMRRRADEVLAGELEGSLTDG